MHGEASLDATFLSTGSKALIMVWNTLAIHIGPWCEVFNQESIRCHT